MTTRRSTLASNFLAYGTPGIAIIDVATGLTANLVGGLPNDPNASGPYQFFRAPFWDGSAVRAFLNRTDDLTQLGPDYAAVTVADDGTLTPRHGTPVDLSGQVAWAPDGSGIAYTAIAPNTDARNPAPFFWLSDRGDLVPLPIAGSTPRWPAAQTSSAADPAELDATGRSLAEFAATTWAITPAADGPGIDGIHAFPAAPSPQVSNGAELWVAHTTGLRGFDPEQFHTVGVFSRRADGWQLLAQLDMGQEVDIDNPEPIPDFVPTGGVTQVDVEPTHLWLQVEGGVGAHSGTFNLLSFDGTTLRSEAGGFSSSPGVGEIADINGDGVGEVILDASDYYVFCYACGVRLAQYDVLRWNGTRFEPVTLQPLSAGAPEVLRAANDRAVELANAGLWRDAQALMLETLDTGETDATYDWNLRLIQLNTGAKRAAAVDTEGGYDILDNIFYGDYGAALDAMRPYTPDQIFTIESPLITGTPAEGSTEILADWIARAATNALAVEPVLAPALYLRGWAAYLASGAAEDALPDVARAAAIAHDDLFYREAVGFLAGNPVPTRAPATATNAPSAAPSATSSTAPAATTPTPRPAATTAPQADTAPVPAPVDSGDGRLFFSAQDADGRDTIYLLEDGDAVPQAVDDAPARVPAGRHAAGLPQHACGHARPGRRRTDHGRTAALCLQHRGQRPYLGPGHPATYLRQHPLW